jgi:hypothetical protein
MVILGIAALARALRADFPMDSLQHQIDKLRPRADALCAALRGAAAALFDEPDVIARCAADTARYRLERDAASGADSLVAEWLDAHGYRLGMLVFHSDGSCFGEYDIIRAHPKRSRWFVEAVEAWAGAESGADGGRMRADFRLLEAP